MAGYSQTPLSHKLCLKPATQFLLLDAPDNYQQLLEPLPGFLKIVTKLPATGSFEVIQAFHTSLEVLNQQLPKYVALLKDDGALWISWYKKSAKKETDIDENLLRQLVLRHGIVDVKVIAVTEEWSGLKMVRRLKDRGK